MSQRRQFQAAAIRLYNSNPCISFVCTSLTRAPLLCFLLPRFYLHTTCSPRRAKKNDIAKEIDVPSHIFRIPGVGQSQSPDPQSESTDLVNDTPPTRSSPPFLKIVMPRSDRSTAGHFRPELPASKSLSGSTISSSEREIFAKLFDQMLTQPISEGKGHKLVKGRKPEKPLDPPSATREFHASIMDDSLLLSPMEVLEYPPALQPLAAKFKRNEPVERKEGDWDKLEERMDECETDYELARFLDTEIFSAMEGHAQNGSPKEGVLPFDVVRANYSLILVKAMRLLRITYNNPLAAHTLFLRAKMLSAESYVLGCTTQLYNELLVSRWESFTDLYSICEILDEMSTNGVKGNGDTIQIIQRIQADVEEWAVHGAEAARAVWLGEKERIGKLDRIQKDMAAELESDVQEDISQIEKEVQTLETERKLEL